MKSLYHGVTAPALRAAGYRRLPGLWVTEAELLAIKTMAEAHKDRINEIRQKARREAEIEAAFEQRKPK